MSAHFDAESNVLARSGKPEPKSASQVCTSCKTRKRKCDKALPKCSQCSKRRSKCEYLVPERPGELSSSVEAAIYQTEPSEVVSLDFPTIAFLDPSLLQHGQLDLDAGPTAVPAQILHLIGDNTQITAIASIYFSHVHTWLPFLLKRRFFDQQQYLCSLGSRPDVAVLLLGLKLITTFPPAGTRSPRTALYETCKQYYERIHGSTTFSLEVLQAGILVALYELGHAIYPAAYLSVGACARYAHALGIHGSCQMNLRRALTLIEVEERRRAGWAVVILDRFVSIGSPGRPLASPNPAIDAILPADDAAWDEGDLTSIEPSTVSSPTIHHMNRFALLCQAARILGQVLHYVSANPPQHADIGIQLDRTLQSMLTAALAVETPQTDQIAFIYSALMALHTTVLHSTQVNGGRGSLRDLAESTIQQIENAIYENLVDKDCFLQRDPHGLSLWALFFAYHICAANIRRQSCFSSTVKEIRQTMTIINARWNVAGVYLQLLEAQEALQQQGAAL